MIMSCSSEENEIPETETKVLVKVEQNQISNGILSEKIIFEYKNNKPTLASFYNENNELTYTSEWIYNSSGYLSSTKGSSTSNMNSNSETNIIYDNSNRIIQTIRSEDNNSGSTTTKFTYNNDNTITSESNSGSSVTNRVKTFVLNDNGIIDKEIVDGNIIVQVEYDNFKPKSKTAFSNKYTYTYLENGLLPATFQSLFGNNPINVVLFQNSLNDSSDSLTTELISEISSNTSTEKYIYTLTSDNFPLMRKDYYNGELNNEISYYYE